MTTKRLTETGISNLAPPPSGRLEVWDAIVPGLGVRIGARRKTFIAMVRAEGRQRRVTLGAHPGLRLAEARSRARVIIEQAQNGVDPVETRRAAQRERIVRQRNTVAAAVEDYIDRYAKPRQRSWLQTKRRLEMYLVAAHGDRPVSSIQRGDIVCVLDAVQAKGFDISANRALANMKTFFGWCLDRGLIERSPTERVRPPVREVSRDRVLSDAE